MSAKFGREHRIYEINGAGDLTGHNFLIFLGTSLDDDIFNVDLAFAEKGCYTFDTIEIQCVKNDDVLRGIDSLRQTTFNTSSVAKNTLNGTIVLSEPKIVCLSVFQTPWWQLLLNDSSVDTIQTQCGFTGVFVPCGEHNIVLKYENPLFVISCIITIIFCCIFFILLVKNFFWSKK